MASTGLAWLGEEKVASEAPSALLPFSRSEHLVRSPSLFSPLLVQSFFALSGWSFIPASFSFYPLPFSLFLSRFLPLLTREVDSHHERT